MACKKKHNTVEYKSFELLPPGGPTSKAASAAFVQPALALLSSINLYANWALEFQRSSLRGSE